MISVEFIIPLYPSFSFRIRNLESGVSETPFYLISAKSEKDDESKAK